MQDLWILQVARISCSPDCTNFGILYVGLDPKICDQVYFQQFVLPIVDLCAIPHSIPVNHQTDGLAQEPTSLD